MEQTWVKSLSIVWFPKYDDYKPSLPENWYIFPSYKNCEAAAHNNPSSENETVRSIYINRRKFVVSLLFKDLYTKFSSLNCQKKSCSKVGRHIEKSNMATDSRMVTNRPNYLYIRNCKFLQVMGSSLSQIFGRETNSHVWECSLEHFCNILTYDCHSWGTRSRKESC